MLALNVPELQEKQGSSANVGSGNAWQAQREMVKKIFPLIATQDVIQTTLCQSQACTSFLKDVLQAHLGSCIHRRFLQLL